MKKRLFAALLSAICLVGLACPSGAEVSQEVVSAEDYFLAMVDDPAFGGMYYDEDGTLVVNFVGTAAVSVPYTAGLSESDVEYRTVAHSLNELEAAKDFLAAYMAEYGILVLDANEVTNEVDVSLSTFDSEIMEEISALMANSYSGISIHFIDCSLYSMQSTVAYEKPDYNSPLGVSASTNIYSGMPIIINDGYYTLGPITSSSYAYTAGHGFTGVQTVYVETGLVSKTSIGSAFGYYGGSNGDWSCITLSNCTPLATCSLNYPVTGKNVYMAGAVSGKQTGKITGTNQTVAASSGVVSPLTGMCSADYSCALGDSGAAIFDAGSTNKYAYGIQSSGLFYSSSGEWAGTSYFTPTDKFF